LKKRASAWISERRRAGATLAEVAAELGLCSGTVLRWSNSVETSPTRPLLPVRVVSDVRSAEALTIVSPSGFRVEGMSFEVAVALLKALG
jgi:hypothetical protein